MGDPPKGLCTGMSPAIWHELAWDPRKNRRATTFGDAASICQVCPVRPACLEYAISLPAGVMQGVIAGYDPRQIAKMRKAKR